MLTNPYQKYQNNTIMTANQGELTLMLYNGAVKFLNQGIEAIQTQDMNKAHNDIMRAQDIIHELHITLDDKREVAKQMEPLYVFIKDLLMQGNIHKDVAQLEQARDLIREFRDIWQEVLKLAK